MESIMNKKKKLEIRRNTVKTKAFYVIRCAVKSRFIIAQLINYNYIM